ncbi:MAG: hypothetical protein AB8G05_12175 [Oligoflexales bacterium]
MSTLKLINEIASSTIPGVIRSSPDLRVGFSHLINKIKVHPINYKEFDTEMFDFGLNLNEKPFKKLVWVYDRGYLIDGEPEIKNQIIPS